MPNEPSKYSRVIIGVLLLGLPLSGQIPQPDGGSIESGNLPTSWMTGGPNCVEVPDWQIHEYNADLYILRESGCTNYEKPFLYLLFESDRALLMDTGAGENVDTLSAVNRVLDHWKRKHDRSSLELIVAHSHGHRDHVAGDAQFRNLPKVQLVEPTVSAVRKAFSIANWPDGYGKLELGNRLVEVIPIPGHEATALAYYDRKTGLLFTGDSLYPGRLYVSDWNAYRLSIHRLVAFTNGKIVAHILGCHIEESAQPYLDYPIGTKYQPNEHPLALNRGDLLELDEALTSMGPKPARLAFRDFTIWPAS